MYGWVVKTLFESLSLHYTSVLCLTCSIISKKNFCNIFHVSDIINMTVLWTYFLSWKQWKHSKQKKGENVSAHKQLKVFLKWMGSTMGLSQGLAFSNKYREQYITHSFSTSLLLKQTMNKDVKNMLCLFKNIYFKECGAIASVYEGGDFWSLKSISLYSGGLTILALVIVSGYGE